MHSTEQFDEIGVHAADAGFKDGFVAHVADELIDFNSGFFDDFFDSGRMDTSVRNQGFNGFFGDFATDGVKSREDDGFRRIIDDQIDAGHGFDGANITAFTTDDAALHFVIGKVDD